MEMRVVEVDYHHVYDDLTVAPWTYVTAIKIVPRKGIETYGSVFWVLRAERFANATRVAIVESPILRHTPCGYWTVDLEDKKHWVNPHARKRFAYPTWNEALESFKKRKEVRIKILKVQIAQARNMAEAAETLQDKLYGGKCGTV